MEKKNYLNYLVIYVVVLLKFDVFLIFKVRMFLCCFLYNLVLNKDISNFDLIVL